MGRGFFPLDEELQLLPGKLTPRAHEQLVRVGSWMPFAQGAQLYEALVGLAVSRPLSQRYTEAAGAAYEDLQDEAAAQLAQAMPEAPACTAHLQVSADGAMVPLVHGVWAEVKTVVIGEVATDGAAPPHAEKLSYFSRKTDADTFGQLALVEMQRRGVENAPAVAAIMDGAEWEQGFVDYHCPQALRILDFAHAATHISAIGAVEYGENTPAGQAWLQAQLHELKHHGPAPLLLALQDIQARHPNSEAIPKHLAYLTRRQDQMRYPLFQAQGWPIGSGAVESANKLVVEARLKGAGMHWAAAHVNPMLSLRNIICSDRWATDWPLIEARLRAQAQHRRTALHQKRTPQPPVAPTPGDAPETRVSRPPPAPPAPPKPNPWRNFRHGKALFRRAPAPKI